MTYTVFKTPGHLDIKAITTFGLSAKPNSKSPIGFFGTGLKMAIAVLVRHKIPITLYIGDKEYRFFTHGDNFRGVEFDFIRMRRRGKLANWQYEKLPYTTQLAKHWEVWMAFRELEANTRDEGGETLEVVTDVGLRALLESSHTCIVVEGEEFSKCLEELDTIFLPEALREPTVDSPRYQIFNKSSEYIYYRGMRVIKLAKPSMFTYNVLETQQLTEDRTLKDIWWLQYQLTEYVVRSDDRAFVNRFLNVTEDFWEYDLPFDTTSASGETFIEAVVARKKQAVEKLSRSGKVPLHASPRMATYYSRLTPPSTHNLLSTHFAEWMEAHPEIEEDEADNKLFQTVLKELREGDITYYA